MNFEVLSAARGGSIGKIATAAEDACARERGRDSAEREGALRERERERDDLLCEIRVKRSAVTLQGSNASPM